MERQHATEQLWKAIKYEAEEEKNIPRKERPDFHVTPPVGWMNDPNGFSVYQGEYHLFYQYHPYSTSWGPMHWGHCKTKDFIDWEQLPCAMAPDMEYDGQGCFSGSAVEHGGKHILMYTGVWEKKEKDGTYKMRQTQNIAVGDGIHYEKITYNPVITADMLPKGSSFEDFRDPKIWKDGNIFYAVIGSRNEDGSGQIALFSSADARKWSFETILDSCHNRWGKMWECPDFFPLQDRQVLITSPQFMEAEGLEIHNGNNAIYFVGSYEKEKKKFRRGSANQIDYGLDFYAPQTVETEDGRRIMIGWLQSWDNYLTPGNMRWSGIMSIPRELSVKEDRLIQNPVRELEKYRKNKLSYKNIHLETEDGEKTLEGINGRSFDMTIEIKKGEYDFFKILLAKDEKYRTALIYDRKKGIFTTDRLYSGMVKDLLSSRSMYVSTENDVLRLRIIMDKYSIEVFVNDGQQAMSSLVYTSLKADQIAFCCEGKAEFSVEKYDIEVH